ncbi:chitinase CLP-like [Aegilops tauschii subsp. strangulata]|uniref:Peptidase A1 domain-containing protein n=1 Tax=Aegilops tauschii subsp. strangulata TaxID=200361 RepID=A0A453GJ87_AEGTS|nr:chitinase CLP-like [Aegilops tauschii subsp. strangulata]
MSLHRSWAAALAALLALAVLLRTSAEDDNGGSPILARVSKDASTSLYTIAIKVGGVPLLLDLAGPMLWLANCPTPHRTIPCVSPDCDEITTTYRPPGCPKPLPGPDGQCACLAYPRNPVDGRCRSADATTITLAANDTDGQNPLFPFPFRAVGSCAPGELLASLPAGAAGVAGLSMLPLSLPTQFASLLSVAKEFALCLPSGSDGVAIFGGGSFQLLAAPHVELAERLRQNPLPLLKHPYNGGYYFGISGIAVNQQRVPTPLGAFDLQASSGTGGVVFSTVTPYTALRWDIYWPLRNAFDAATSGIARADKVAPFDMCYQASALTVTRVGYAVANIDMMLDGGRNWTLPGASSLVQVNDQTVCFAFVQMASSMPTAADSPAVIFGGHQMENNLLMFDLVKETFAFSGLLLGIRTTCSNFNFTMGSY